MVKEEALRDQISEISKPRFNVIKRAVLFFWSKTNIWNDLNESGVKTNFSLD